MTRPSIPDPMRHVLIVGGGFAGVWAALAAARARRALARDASSLRVTLVSRDPWLTIRPRLYESDPRDARVRLDELFPDGDVDLVVGDVVRVDAVARAVTLRAAGTPLSYDRLVLAAGSQLRPPAVPGAARAFTVDTHADATRLYHHLAALPRRGARAGRFTAVVVGSGLTGLEVAAELTRRLRALGGAEARVVLVERGATVGPDLGAEPRPLVESALRDLGVELRLGRAVASVERDGITLGGGERISAATTVWASGLRASALAAQLLAERDALGRVSVDDDLRVRGVDAVFAAGDVAHAMADAEHVAPMSCQFAIPMGDCAGHNAAAELLGAPVRRFAPPPYVTCVDLGDWGALFTEGWERRVRLAGFWAKTMKETINTRLIYPPRAAGARAPLAPPSAA